MPASWETGSIETGPKDAVRVDQWLWAVRVFKTRSNAATACRGGHVSVNGRTAKPATAVKVGDRVFVRADRRERDLEVTKLLTKRVGAALAAEHLVDHTPPPDPVEASRAPLFERERGTGRPTKRDRRQLDQLRGRRPG